MLTQKEDEKLYDLSTIEMFCHGNQNAVKEMVVVFIKEVSGLADALRSAYGENDFTTIKNLVHKIKPVISYCAMPKVENELTLINELGKQADTTGELALRIDALDSLIKNVVVHITKNVLHA